MQKTVQAYRLWHAWLIHLPRLSRFTLGTKIETLFVELIELILLAGYSHRDQKLAIVTRASSKVDLLKFFLQLAWEFKVIDSKKYQVLSPSLLEVGMMLGGWRKQLNQKSLA